MLLALSTDIIAKEQSHFGVKANQYHQFLVNENDGIGAREAGSKQEQATAQFIKETFKEFGLAVEEQVFTIGKRTTSSINIIANTNKHHEKTIVLGAHLDSTAQKLGSLGATDNGAGVAAMLAIAEAISQIKLNYNVRFIAFGAEETGRLGSQHYVNNLTAREKKQIIAMINFDTIAGGDKLYVHSAHTTPYQCNGVTEQYSSEPHIRDALLNVSKKLLTQSYHIHAKYSGYPEGVTGSWSDHYAFACAGIPIAYVEATNFTIHGKKGFDGYSQTIHPEFWDCFDQQKNTACNRKLETKWGEIWHTRADRLETLEQLFPGRIAQQISDNVKVVIEFLSNADHYVAL